jgi:phage terminase small subunit
MDDAENRSLSDIWEQLTPSQKKFVVAYQRHVSKADAAEEVGLAASTVYSWPDRVDRAAELFSDATAELAMQELEEALVEAAMVKTQEVRDPGSTEESQQDAATDVLDRVMGRPTQKQDVDMDAEVDVESSDLDDAIDALAKVSNDFT